MQESRLISTGIFKDQQRNNIKMAMRMVSPKIHIPHTSHIYLIYKDLQRNNIKMATRKVPSLERARSLSLFLYIYALYMRCVCECVCAYVCVCMCVYKLQGLQRMYVCVFLMYIIYIYM